MQHLCFFFTEATFVLHVLYNVVWYYVLRILIGLNCPFNVVQCFSFSF